VGRAIQPNAAYFFQEREPVRLCRGVYQGTASAVFTSRPQRATIAMKMGEIGAADEVVLALDEARPKPCLIWDRGRNDKWESR
jgi:hypothetical protein